ncbi:putative ABC transport system permease protein [Flavimobilis soli]|uniref:Putative ABC transport system permease protein n=1 Tax=Flavimobilis soli TaxID=442709 RepID=A0A2A9EGD2_9MICO|nr:ABC transporter permease [Flavimobilis soli]PFG37279.1 putative ABC transport system permease protein [Flavimobilis soli]
MIRVALRGIRAHFVRFGMAVLAVALGVAFVAGTYSLRAVLASTFDAIVDSSYSAQAYVRGADMVVGMDGTTGSAGSVHAPIPASLVDTVREVDGVDRAYADHGGTLVLVGKDGTAVTTSGAPTLGVALARDDTVVRVTDGDYAVGPDQIVLEESTAERAGLTTGDRTKIILQGDILDVTVVGLAHFDATMAGALLIGLDPEVAAAAYSPDGTVSTISVYAEPGVSETQLRDALAQTLAASSAEGAAQAEVVTGDSMREEQSEAIGSMLGFIQVFLLVFAGVSLFVGGFLIANTFSMSVRERMREFALLRAIGASPSQVFASILGQALVIGVLGSAVGIGLGIGIAAGLSALLAGMGMEMGGAVALTADTVVISLVVGTVVSLVAAAIPARRAALTAPVEAMRAEAPSEKGLRVRTAIGAVLTLAGIGGVVYASLARTADGLVVDGAPTMLGIGAVTLVVGMLVLAPVLARWVVPVLAAPFAAWGKPLGGLARGNVVRNPRRTASTAGALMIGMVLVSASGVLAASTTASIGSVIESDLKADLIVQSMEGDLPRQAADAMAAAPSVDTLDVADYGVTFASGTTTPQFVFSAEPSLWERSIDVTVEDGELASFERGEALALKPAAKSNGWEVGDVVTLGAEQGVTTGAGGTQVRIGAIIDSQAFGGAMFVPRDVYEQVVRPELSGIAVAFATAADGFTQDQLRADLVEIVKPYFVISVMDAEEMVNALADQVNMMLTVIYALLGLSVLIAVLGIVNTLALSIIERTREVALLRAVGLGRLQLSSMVAIESVLTALFGTILGVAVGVGIATALPAVFKDEGMTQLVVPWGTLGGMVVLAAVVGLVAAVWPSIRAARMPVLDGLAAE